MHDALIFLNLLCCGIVTGTYAFEMMVVIPATSSVPDQLSAQIHGALFSHLPNRYMPWLAISAGISALALLFFADVTDTGAVLYGVGSAAWAATSVILVGFSRPLDKQITDWARTQVPEGEYAAARKKWNRLMITRGPLGLLSFSCFIAASLS